MNVFRLIFERKLMSAVQKIMMLSLFAGLLAAGCGSGDEPATTPEEPGVQLMAATQVVPGTQTLCPIMGNPIVEDSFADHEGKRVYFCCPGCDGKFNEDPHKFIEQMESEGIVLATIIEK
jgi:YHS domain-containing protein